MRKLQLKLESLEVESFDTEKVNTSRGTVLAAESNPLVTFRCGPSGLSCICSDSDAGASCGECVSEGCDRSDWQQCFNTGTSN